MLGLAESVIFPIAELQPLSRKAMRWHSLAGQTARMYCLELFSCGIAPVGKGLLTTTVIEPALIRVCSVSGVPERERTADDHSRSDHWEPCHHRHIEQTTPLRLTCQQRQCRRVDASVEPCPHNRLMGHNADQRLDDSYSCLSGQAAEQASA